MMRRARGHSKARETIVNESVALFVVLKRLNRPRYFSIDQVCTFSPLYMHLKIVAVIFFEKYDSFRLCTRYLNSHPLYVCKEYPFQPKECFLKYFEAKNPDQESLKCYKSIIIAIKCLCERKGNSYPRCKGSIISGCKESITVSFLKT